MKKQFVLSASEFDNIKTAEKWVNGRWTGGDDIKKKTKLYQVTAIYDLKLRFERRKK